MVTRTADVFTGVDLSEARQLIDLMSNAVAEMERQESPGTKKSEGTWQSTASRPLRILASAADQLSVCVRPPNIAIAQIAGGVTKFGLLFPSLARRRIFQC
jgi:hypothetical protein